MLTFANLRSLKKNAFQNKVTPLGTWTVFDVGSQDAVRPTPDGMEGMYRIKSLQPGTSYEVDLVGQNSVGQSNPYIVVFRTSDLLGTSGKLLGEPKSQFLHGNGGNRMLANWILLYNYDFSQISFLIL
ncbi:hypothetical protein ACTXT7_017072 [Hymenolepis weldensis]